MPYINLPPVVSELFWELEKRVGRLENAYRFNVPNVSFVPTPPSNSRIGDMFYDLNADVLKYWNGTEWVVIADDNVGSEKIPFVSTWSGTGLVKTGTPATGYYIKIGKMIFFTINVSCATVTNFGTGQYSLTLPFSPQGDYMLLNGGLHDMSTGDHYQISGDIEDAEMVMTLWYHENNGKNGAMKYNQPIALTTSDYFYISGSYFIE